MANSSRPDRNQRLAMAYVAPTGFTPARRAQLQLDTAILLDRLA